MPETYTLQPNTEARAQPFLANLLLFLSTLRRAGLPVSLNQTLDLTQALELVDLSQRAQVFHAARGILVNRKEERHLFEIIFNIFWRSPAQHQRGQGQPAPIAPRHNLAQQKRPVIVTLMAQKAQASDPEVEMADKSGTFSAAEVLQRKQFSDMTPEELATVKKIIQSMRWRVSMRKTRRFAPDKNGSRLNLRRVMRSCVKYGGVPLRLSWKQRTEKARPVIVLADISGSMERYTRLLLQFYYSLTRGLRDVECFLFGTRLTRITPQLRIRNVDQAISQAANQVVDWAGGTRIGECLHTFNREWSRRVLRRGAIVLIISDGWERGDTGLLRQQMRYLQLRCHRLIWLNPLLGQADYQPQVEGMAAALPFVDDFLPIHNLQSLEMLAEHLAALDDH